MKELLLIISVGTGALEEVLERLQRLNSSVAQVKQNMGELERMSQVRNTLTTAFRIIDDHF